MGPLRGRLQRAPSCHAAPLLLLAACLYACCTCAVAEFRPGDFVPIARRAQFHGSRTQWHDLVGNLCPRFAQTRTVALPLPHPVGLAAGDEYKLALSVAGERFATPWLTLTGPRAPVVPALEAYSGAEVVGVQAEVRDPAPEVLRLHPELEGEWRNASAWPKRLLVRYSWREESEEDLSAAAYVLLGTGVAAAAAMLVSALIGHEAQLGHFFREAMAERGGGGGVDALAAPPGLRALVPPLAQAMAAAGGGGKRD